MSAQPPIVVAKNLRRVFDNVVAVHDLSFEIHPGQVVGFIGANGAGKTTTMRMMASLDVPTRGRISVGGYDVVNFPHKVRGMIGWMPDHYGTYDHMTVHEYLDFYGRAYGFSADERDRRVAEVMEFTDLTAISTRMMNKLSKGMGQRLCLGRTLLHDPELLILDEPAAGLDPKARMEFKNLVRLLAERGKTIFISSHILSELGEMCDSLLFIDAGRIVHHGTAETLEQTTVESVFDVRVIGDPAALIQWLALQPDAALIDRTQQSLRIKLTSQSQEDAAAFLRRMIQADFAIIEFHRERRRLEDAFVDMLKTPPPLPPGMEVTPR